MAVFIKGHESNLGLVSPEVPLISNLPVWRNIALIRQYHENMPADVAKSMVLDLLQRFGIVSTAEMRSPSLSDQERFCIMLIRAATVREAVVLLDRPFRILPDLPDGRFFMDAIRKVDDLIVEVHIFDYNREKERYRTNDDAEN